MKVRRSRGQLITIAQQQLDAIEDLLASFDEPRAVAATIEERVTVRGLHNRIARYRAVEIGSGDLVRLYSKDDKRWQWIDARTITQSPT